MSDEASGDPYARLIGTLWALAAGFVAFYVWTAGEDGPAWQVAGFWLQVLGLLAILVQIALTKEQWGTGAGWVAWPLKVFGFEIGAEPEPLRPHDSVHTVRSGRAGLKFKLPSEDLQALSEATEEALNSLRGEIRTAEKEAAQARGRMQKRLTEKIDKLRSSVGKLRVEIREAQVEGIRLEKHAAWLICVGLAMQVFG